MNRQIEGDTMDIKELLFGLTDTDGVSGAEENAGAFALARLRSYTNDAYIDSFGSVIGKIGVHSKDKPTLLLDAHIDEIGMIVTYIDEKGFVKVGNCGGLDRRLLLAQQVCIHGRQPVPGVICSKPPHLLSDEEKKKAPEVADIAIDTGYSKEQLEGLISLGDRITFYAVNRELLNGRVSGKSFDDRSGVAAILMALDLLQTEGELPFNLTVLFSSQEEVGERGAHIAAFNIAPDYAVAVDVSFGLTSDSMEDKCGKMGQGGMIGISPSLNRAMSDRLIALAKEKEIPYQIEIMPELTGTNADVIAVTKGGVRAVTLSIPLRYMHTPIETIVLSDLEAVARLLCVFAKEGMNHA